MTMQKDRLPDLVKKLQTKRTKELRTTLEGNSGSEMQDFLDGEEGRSMVFRNVSILPQHYTTAQHSRHRLEYFRETEAGKGQ
jgi:hypothetical protein